ncbi:hypothetical protein PQ478_21875 (plasmid) [Alkalihalophilus pseudofirmus]|uniref:hypothetical protein n=1 Tax=Alkalihalophilus pseudofirmus TaxID=79885 RepID=UPI00259AFFC7|nr:hypothetical protein [Alkalihalophilus pseudofirmus]WEG19205.1 hypothetical protein PQ478_21875 [Alkalihalophilus pseudofirmus]
MEILQYRDKSMECLKKNIGIISKEDFFEFVNDYTYLIIIMALFYATHSIGLSIVKLPKSENFGKEVRWLPYGFVYILAFILFRTINSYWSIPGNYFTDIIGLMGIVIILYLFLLLGLKNLNANWYR